MLQNEFKMNADGTGKIPQEFHGNIIELELNPFEIITLFVKQN